MSQFAYALLGLTAIVGLLAGILAFAALRFAAAARDTRRSLRDASGAPALMASAIGEALSRLREQELAMTARAEASERLAGQIVASLTAGLIVVGLEGETRIINPAARRLLGIPGGEPVGSFKALLAQATPLTDVIDECLETKEPIVRRSLELPQRGTASHIGVTVSPLSDGNGECHGAICLFTDLTAVVDLEEQLRLKDSLARLGELTAGLAHELRNSLATIHGYGRLIDPDSVPAAYRPCVEGIRQETDALGQMITNFLNFARPAQMTVCPVDLAQLLERATEEYRQEARAHGGDIVLDGEFPMVEGDETLLRQAFGNLLRNAIEACVSVATPPAISVQGHVEREQGQARIAVADNGPGIDPAMRERVFRPFFTTRPQGTGLGLALVQKIVVTHNGRITAGAAQGGGASLQVVLPLLPAA
jgi:PAS domain S-box-containing protein